YSVRIVIDPQCAMPIAARQLVLKALSGHGEVLGSRPEANSGENAQLFELLVASDKASEHLVAKCRIRMITSQVQIETVELAGSKKSTRTKPAPQASTVEGIPSTSPVAPEDGATHFDSAGIHEDENSAKKMGAGSENTLRVDPERIDNVLNLVGELII